YGSCCRNRSRGRCGRGPSGSGSRRFHLGWDHSRLLRCHHDVR
uniref:Uncharacterized protein n=1 Tax=Gasterosteus aculeatus TaxID=69293 RepID=G3NU59_GASAC